MGFTILVSSSGPPDSVVVTCLPTKLTDMWRLSLRLDVDTLFVLKAGLLKQCLTTVSDVTLKTLSCFYPVELICILTLLAVHCHRLQERLDTPVHFF